LTLEHSRASVCRNRPAGNSIGVTSLRSRLRSRSDAGPPLWARFASRGDARTAIEALQEAGVDGNDIELLGTPPGSTSSVELTRAVDRRIAGYLAGRVGRAILIGAVGGLLAGTTAAAVLIAATAPASALAELIAVAIVGVLLGATCGAYVGFERAGTLSDAWPLTFEDARGPVWIAVFTAAPADRERVRGIVERHHALEVQPDNDQADP
jgi:MFS family permease